MATATEPDIAVIDASAVIALCSAEPDREDVVDAYIDECAAAGRPIYSAGVLVAECLHVFCRKLGDGVLDAASHTAAVQTLVDLLNGIESCPEGEWMLFGPAEVLSRGRGCAQTNDSFYLALAERLAADGKTVEVVTFDVGQAGRADGLPSVTGRLLTVL